MSVEDLSNTQSESITASISSEQPDESRLRGNLGVGSLIAAVIAFNGPLAVFAGFIPVVIYAGNGLSAPLTFIALGLVILIFSVGLNAMASRMTHPGAFYTYITAGIGRSAGLAAGLLAFVTYIALGSGTCALFAITADHLVAEAFGIDGPSWWVWALLGCIIATVLSLFNIEVSAKVLGVFMILEIVTILVYDACVLIRNGPEGRAVNIFSDFFSGSFPLAMVFGALALTGFESLQVFRSETKDHEKTVPRATYISIVIITCLHALTAFCYIVAYGPGQALLAGVEDPTGSVLTSISTYIFTAAGDIANVLLLTSTFAACLAIQNISARYLFMFGRDRVLPSVIGKVSQKHGSPMIAAAVSGVLTAAAFLVPAAAGFTQVETFIVLTGVGGFWLIGLWVATSVAVVVFFHSRRTVEHAGVFQVLIAPIVSAVALGATFVSAVIHLADVLGNETVATVSLVFLGALLIGGLLLGLWYRAKRPEVYERIGNQTETVYE